MSTSTRESAHGQAHTHTQPPHFCWPCGRSHRESLQPSVQQHWHPCQWYTRHGGRSALRTSSHKSHKSFLTPFNQESSAYWGHGDNLMNHSEVNTCPILASEVVALSRMICFGHWYKKAHCFEGVVKTPALQKQFRKESPAVRSQIRGSSRQALSTHFVHQLSGEQSWAHIQL